jgi:hypothetical protein
MPLTSTSAAPERILSMGMWGAGKTHAWTTLSKWYRETNTPGIFHVLDSDNTSLRSLDNTGNWEENVVRADVSEWTDLTGWTDKYTETAVTGDWLVIDSIDAAWSLVQDYYISEQFGQDSADFFLAARKANQSGHPLASDYGSNWQVINRLYQRWIMKVIRWPGHVYAATPAQQVTQPNQSGKGGDSKDIRDAFGRYGMRPAGQKNLGFQFHTVLLMASPSKDQYTVTSVKDRSRELLVNQPVSDFTIQYLCGTAGWELSG